jgi:hypothetical protein
MFNPQQQELSDNLSLIINTGKTGIVLIEGDAGTGKTYTVVETIKSLNVPVAKLCLCAPTDTSKDNLVLTLDRYPAKTIYSLLGYYPEPNHDGVMELINPDIEKEVPFYIIIVDEIFCVPNVLIMDMYTRQDILWIVLGDEGQLKAIGDDTPILKDPDFQFLYQTTLTKQERSLSTCYPIIQAIKEQGNLYRPEYYLPQNRFFENFYDAAREGKNVVYVAYTNAAVNEAAAKIRLNLYEPEDEKPIVGEKLKMKRLFNFSGTKKLIFNNEIVTVTEVAKDGFFVNNKRGLNIFCPYMEYDENGISYLDLAKQEIDEAETPFLKKKGWVKWYKILERYARWISPFSSTAHLLQGTTVEEAFLDYGDLLRCTNDPNLIYSAASRARHFVHFKR